MAPEKMMGYVVLSLKRNLRLVTRAEHFGYVVEAGKRHGDERPAFVESSLQHQAVMLGIPTHLVANGLMCSDKLTQQWFPGSSGVDLVGMPFEDPVRLIVTVEDIASPGAGRGRTGRSFHTVQDVKEVRPCFTSPPCGSITAAAVTATPRTTRNAYTKRQEDTYVLH